MINRTYVVSEETQVISSVSSKIRSNLSGANPVQSVEQFLNLPFILPMFVNTILMVESGSTQPASNTAPRAILQSNDATFMASFTGSPLDMQSFEGAESPDKNRIEIIPLRYWLQTNKKLYAKIHSIIIKEMHRYYINKAKLAGIEKPYPGSISFTQRAGSAANLNPHMHVLLLDGVYTDVNGVVRFRNIDSITDDEVAWLCENIAKKVMRHLTKEG